MRMANPKQAIPKNRMPNAHFFLMAIKGIVVAFLVFLPPLQLFGMDLELEPKLLNKEFIEKLKWDDRDSINDLTNDWDQYTKDQKGKEGFKDRTILKEFKMKIGGLPFNLSLRQYHKTSRYEIVAVIDIEKVTDFSELDDSVCQDYVKLLVTQFGQPSVNVDLLHSYIDVGSQWEIGNTRINFSCIAIKVGKKYEPFMILLHYGYIDDIKPKKGAILLKCSSKMKYIGLLADQGTTEKPPITIIVHLDRKELYGRSIQVGKTIKFNNREIIAENNTEKGHNVFRLDRIAGNYTWTIRLKKKGPKESGADLWGECKQISQEQKF